MTLQPEQLQTFVVFNPVAGTSDQDQVLDEIKQVLRENQIEHHIHQTQKDDDLHLIVQAALDRDYQRFIAVGGDGTVSGVTSGLVNTGIPVAIVPTGTVNSMARILGIPRKLEDAARWWLSTQRTKSIDVMEVDQRYFILNLSVGMSSQALADVKREDKRRWGSFAYWIRGIQQLMGISPYNFQIQIDDNQVINRRASDVAIANSGIVQLKPLKIKPEFHVDDGVLSVCYLRAKNILDYLRVALGILNRNPTKLPELSCKDTCHKVTVRSRQRLPVQADGDIIGYTPVMIKVQPAAADFLIPDE